jgi:cytoskeletal protein CcmA (bactofilin family)
MVTELTATATSVVSKGARIEADIRGGENLLIDGYVKGSIVLEGDIIVGPTGVAEAELKANNVIIQGTVRGNVTARQHLEILSSGNMTGDISARSIDLREGSSFEGRSRMIKSNIAEPAPKKPADATKGQVPESRKEGKPDGGDMTNNSGDTT